MMIVQDQAATIQTLEAERNKLREQCAEISQRSMMIMMMMIVMMMMMIMMIMMMITTTSPSHRSQAPCSGQISSEGGFLLLALDLKLFLLSVWFLPYQLDEIKTYPSLQEVLVLVRLMVMGSTNHLLLSFFFSFLTFLYFCATHLAPAEWACELLARAEAVRD